MRGLASLLFTQYTVSGLTLASHAALVDKGYEAKIRKLPNGKLKLVINDQSGEDTLPKKMVFDKANAAHASLILMSRGLLNPQAQYANITFLIAYNEADSL